MRGVDGSGIPDCPNGVRGSHLAIFPDIGTHSSGSETVRRMDRLIKEGETRTDFLREAVELLIKRHEAERTRGREDDTLPL